MTTPAIGYITPGGNTPHKSHPHTFHTMTTPAIGYITPGGNTPHKSHPHTFHTITELSPWWIGKWRWGVVASCRGSRMNWRGAQDSDLSPCRSILAVPSASWELWKWIHCLCRHPRDPPVTKSWRHASALPTNQCDVTWNSSAGPCGKRSYTLSGTLRSWG